MCVIKSICEHDSPIFLQTNIGLVATASDNINSTMPAATLPCNPPPYSVSVQPEELVQTFAAEKQPWEQF